MPGSTNQNYFELQSFIETHERKGSIDLIDMVEPEHILSAVIAEDLDLLEKLKTKLNNTVLPNEARMESHLKAKYLLGIELYKSLKLPREFRSDKDATAAQSKIIQATTQMKDGDGEPWILDEYKPDQNVAKYVKYKGMDTDTIPDTQKLLQGLLNSKNKFIEKGAGPRSREMLRLFDRLEFMQQIINIAIKQ